MEIMEKICTKNQCYQVGKSFTPKGLTLHSVGCNQPSAVVFANKFNTLHPDGRQICVHGFIGAICGEVVQTLPWTMRGWHGGSGAKGSVNDTHIGIEMCEPACIKYTQGATFTCSDLTTARKNCETAYNSAVELFAYLCKKFGFDPLADGVIISHYEGNCRGIASNHSDPEHLWRGLGMSYTMDGFRRDVAALMGSGIMSDDDDDDDDDDDTDESFCVRVLDPALNIRAQPSLTAKINGVIRDKGVYTIVAQQYGSGVLWGKLKSGAGWISLGSKYVKRI